MRVVMYGNLDVLWLLRSDGREQFDLLDDFGVQGEHIFGLIKDTKKIACGS